MPVYKLKLIHRKEVARNTFEFHFEKPDNLTFKPGQYGGFTLINPPETDAGGITRRFSLLSTPDDSHLAIATRLQTSAFKRVLKDMPLQTEVKFAGPTGAFTLHEDPVVPAVFIAGGIGIAPFYSMIRHAAAQRSSQQILLFYGNREKNDAPFLTELLQIEDQHPFFKLIPVFEKADADWEGEKGYINDAILRKYIPDLNAPIYYICGSPVMVTAIQELLAELDINPDQVNVEDFPGY
jgi:ferredoxin-NADP reductase